MNELFVRGVAEFNAGRFFEAHDVWEELWRETSGESRIFYQGLIQSAVGLYHLTTGNHRGACSQLRKSLAKLEHYLPAYHGINTQDLVDRVRRCLRDAELPGSAHPVVTDPRPTPQIHMYT
jgi:uncharacterized protein